MADMLEVSGVTATEEVRTVALCDAPCDPPCEREAVSSHCYWRQRNWNLCNSHRMRLERKQDIDKPIRTKADPGTEVKIPGTGISVSRECEAFIIEQAAARQKTPYETIKLLLEELTKIARKSKT